MGPDPQGESTMLTRLVTCLVVTLALVGWFVVAGPAPAAADPPNSADAQGAHSASQHGEAPQPGDVQINPLEFKADLALWTAVVFLVLLLVLGKFAWRPIATGLERRERRIADEIASAERSNVEARQLLQQYEERLAASGEEVQQMLDAARRDAEHVGHQIVEKAKADAEVEHQRALEEIDQAAANALKELAEESATLAVDLAGKIVHSQLDPKAHSHLIEQAVTDFSKPQSGKDGPIGN